jgi:DNA-binding MarR family transcriptional regulator
MAVITEEGKSFIEKLIEEYRVWTSKFLSKYSDDEKSD